MNRPIRRPTLLVEQCLKLDTFDFWPHWRQQGQLFGELPDSPGVDLTNRAFRLDLGPDGLRVHGAYARLPRCFYPILDQTLRSSLLHLYGAVRQLGVTVEERTHRRGLELLVTWISVSEHDLRLDLQGRVRRTRPLDDSVRFADDRIILRFARDLPRLSPPERQARRRLLEQTITPAYDHLRGLYARLPDRIRLPGTL
jgi:hypothetical protein